MVDPRKTLAVFEKASIFFHDSYATEESKLFGCLVLMDIVPSELGVDLYRRMAREAASVYLDEKGFDPVEYYLNVEEELERRVKAEKDPNYVATNLHAKVEDDVCKHARANQTRTEQTQLEDLVTAVEDR